MRIYTPCADEVYWHQGRCPAADNRCMGCHRRPELRPEIAADLAARERDHAPGPGRLGVGQVLRLVAWWAECSSCGGTLGGQGSGTDEPEFLLIRSQLGVSMSHVDHQMGLAWRPAPASWMKLKGRLVECALDRGALDQSVEAVRWFLSRTSTYVPLVACPALVDSLEDRLRANLTHWLADLMVTVRCDIRQTASYAESIERLRYVLADVVDQWPRLATIAGLDTARLRPHVVSVVG